MINWCIDCWGKKGPIIRWHSDILIWEKQSIYNNKLNDLFYFAGVYFECSVKYIWLKRVIDEQYLFVQDLISEVMYVLLGAKCLEQTVDFSL